MARNCRPARWSFWRSALGDIFAADHYVKSRVGQVSYLWQPLKKAACPWSIPPPAMRSLSMSKHFCRVEGRSFRLKRWRHLFITCGNTIDERSAAGAGPNGARRGTVTPGDPGAQIFACHFDDVAEAILYAYATSREIGDLNVSKRRIAVSTSPPISSSYERTTVQLYSLDDRTYIGEIFFRRVNNSVRRFIKLQMARRARIFPGVIWRPGAKHSAGAYSSWSTCGESIAIIGENSLEWACADLPPWPADFLMWLLRRPCPTACC